MSKRIMSHCLAGIVSTACISVLCTDTSVLGAVKLEATYEADRNLTIGSPSVPLGQSGTTVGSGKLNVSGSSAYVDYGPAGNYFNYASGTSWGSNTIVMIIRPTAVNPSRHWLASTAGRFDGTLATNGNAGENSISLYDAGSGTVELTLSSYYNPAVINNDVLRNNNSNYGLAANTDYFVAVSWQDDATPDDTSNLNMRLYVRKLSDLAGTDFVSYVSTTGITSPADYRFAQFGNPGFKLENQKWTVGNRPERTESLAGGVDYHQIFDSFVDTQSQFDSLFVQVTTGVPEPSSLGLMALGAAAAFRRRK